MRMALLPALMCGFSLVACTASNTTLKTDAELEQACNESEQRTVLVEGARIWTAEMITSYGKTPQQMKDDARPCEQLEKRRQKQIQQQQLGSAPPSSVAPAKSKGK